MKAILITAVFSALLLGNSEGQAPPPGQDSVTQKVRKFWVKSKGYLSEDLPTFKEGAEQTLLDLDKEIKIVGVKAGDHSPPYFQMRLQALRLQHEHLINALKQIDAEAVKNHMSGPRYAFDKCMDALETAVTQAADEAEVLAKLNEVPKTTGI